MKSIISDPNEVTSSSVISLLVKDPRFVLPKKKSFNNVNKQNKQLNLFSKNQMSQGFAKSQLTILNFELFHGNCFFIFKN